MRSQPSWRGAENPVQTVAEKRAGSAGRQWTLGYLLHESELTDIGMGGLTHCFYWHHSIVAYVVLLWFVFLCSCVYRSGGLQLPRRGVLLQLGACFVSVRHLVMVRHGGRNVDINWLLCTLFGRRRWRSTISIERERVGGVCVFAFVCLYFAFVVTR